MSARIATAIHQVMSACGYVQKTGRNAFHNYKYAGEADLLEKLRPAMLDAGLLLLPSVKRVSPIDDHGNVTVEMEYTLAHKDGDIWPEKIGAVGCGNDRSKSGSVGDKGVYKAITGANKYLLFKLFQIETGDDPDNDAHGDPHSRAVPVKSTELPKSIAPPPQSELASKFVNAAIAKLETLKAEKAKTPKEIDDMVKGMQPGMDKYGIVLNQGDAGKALYEAILDFRNHCNLQLMNAG